MGRDKAHVFLKSYGKLLLNQNGFTLKDVFNIFAEDCFLRSNSFIQKLFPGKGIGNFNASLKLTQKTFFKSVSYNPKNSVAGKGKGLRGEGNPVPKIWTFPLP
ncbi:hypothetical protein [Aedoeadaptatus nemausensis]|uniref:hypothetical protein n=1 Tax=Aedoeadaptatus nemausensis TaxID=2582829 RepID=UPI0015D77351|nr:hypothetical protein [Peptoniphilus nemausensis]